MRLRWEQAGYHVFLPKIKKIVRGAVRPSERIRPLFPSYIFARLQLEDAEVFRNVKYTRGVHRILGSRDHPVPVADEVVKIIAERMGKDGVLEQKLLYKQGDPVRLKHGPLADLVGILEKPVSAAGRVRILLEVYHKTIRADLSCAEIESVS